MEIKVYKIMKKLWKKIVEKSNVFSILILSVYATAIGLIVASFILPPPGVIDSSILAAGGELFGFAGLLVVIYAISLGKHAKITKDQKGTSIDVG